MDGQGLGDTLRSAAAVWGRRLVDAALPPRCLACGEEVSGSAGVCARCWGGLRFLAPPWCRICGLPFDFDPGAAAVCDGCSARPPVWASARAALAYDAAARPLVLGFKHGDRTLAAPVFAAWIAQAAAAELAGADLLVPVPLHYRRLVHRRYNQAAVIAQALHRAGGPPVSVDALVRRRATPSQANRDRAARYANVADAFAVPPRRHAAIADRRLVLVDDVMTSGATMAACAETLLAAGATAVHVVTLARVLPGGDGA